MKLQPPSKPRRKLTKIDVNFVSLVPQGANPDAHIILVKEFTMENSLEKGLSVNIDETVITGILQKGITELFAGKEKPDLDAEAVKKALDGIVTEISGSLTKTVESAVAKALEEKKPEEKKPDGEMPEETKKSLDESFKVGDVTISKADVGDKAYAALIDLQKQVAKTQHEAMLKGLEVEVEKAYPNLPGTVREKAILLSAVNNLPAETANLAKQYFDQANKNLGETMIAKGDGTAPKDVSVSKQAELKLDEMAKALSEKENIQFATAFGKILDTPEGTALYEQYTSNRE